MSAVSTKSLAAIGKEHGVSAGHLSYIASGQRDGAYRLYVALRAASQPLTLSAIEREAAAKVRHQRAKRKEKK